MSKKNIEKFSDIIRICYDEDENEIECNETATYIECHINDENMTPVDCPPMCVDDDGNEVTCNDFGFSSEEWKNELLYSQNYCRSDCNGLMIEDEFGNILGCDTSNINNFDEYKKKMFLTVLDNPKACNIDKVAPKKQLTLYHANEELLNSKLKTSLDIYKENVNYNNSTSNPLLIEEFNDDSNFKYINKTIHNIIDLDDKTMDSINATENEKVLEHFKNTDDFNNSLKKTFRKYTNFVSIAMEVVNNYKDAILDESNNTTQKDASSIMRATYQSFLKNGIVYDILGSNNNISEFERLIFEKTNVDLLEPVPVDGVTVDENGNLQEHQSGVGGGSYLITALTKHQHLSLGQVYQLRKLMLKSFNNQSNRKFFSFYYENFEHIANMLVKENKLIEIMPNMLKCIDLVKKGLFDEAFEQYILTARQAYMICKEMGMDTVELEEKWDRLDGYIDELPEPNSLFVEKSFEKAISVGY